MATSLRLVLTRVRKGDQEKQHSLDQRQNQPTFQLPQEIWPIIFSSLSGRDLQTASDVCKNFRDILMPTLWHEPPFKKNSISMKELQEIAESNLPIRVLRLSQLKIDLDRSTITRYHDVVDREESWVKRTIDESQFKRLIKILKSCQLVSFILDECDKSLHELTQKQLRLLCQLPITHVNTMSFHPDIIPALIHAKKFPEMTITADFHKVLSTKDWKDLVRFPIVQITVDDFEQYPLDEYDDYICDNIRPQPRFIILTYGDVTPSQLQTIKRIKIFKLHLYALYIQDGVHNIMDFFHVLIENNQRPIIVFPLSVTFSGDEVASDIGLHDITPSDLQCIFQFPVEVLNTQILRFVDGTADTFAELIAKKHIQSPFRMFVIDQSQEFFTNAHLEKFKLIGLNPILPGAHE